MALNGQRDIDPTQDTHTGFLGSIQIMRRNGKSVRTLTALLAVALLLTQWATAAFACATSGPVDGVPPVVVVEIAADMGGMAGCSQMSAVAEPPTVDSTLCHAHCNQGSQATATPFGLDQPASPVGLSGFWEAAPWPDIRLVAGNHQVPRPKPTSGWPPPYLSFLVLRN